MEVNELLSGLNANNFKAYDNSGNPVIFKNKCIYRFMYLDNDKKEFYQAIKNKFLSYGARSRITNRMEIFSYKGRLALFIVRRKSISLYLNLDKKYLEEKKYHLKDRSYREKFAKTPLLLKVRSNRACKNALELIDIMFAQKNKKLKRGFKPLNLIPSLVPSGEAILNKLGFKADYNKKSIDAKNISKDIPREMNEYLPKITKEKLKDEVIANISLDTLCVHFQNGDIISLEVLKEKQIVTRGNYLKIKARGNLSKRFIIIADEFEPDALAMLLCTNSQVILIER